MLNRRQIGLLIEPYNDEIRFINKRFLNFIEMNVFSMKMFNRTIKISTVSIRSSQLLTNCCRNFGNALYKPSIKFSHGTGRRQTLTTIEDQCFPLSAPNTPVQDNSRFNAEQQQKQQQQQNITTNSTQLDSDNASTR